MSEYEVLMQEAIRHFRISEQSWPTNAEIVPYFMAKKLSNGMPIGDRAARHLAMFCRPTEAIKGGNVK